MDKTVTLSVSFKVSSTKEIVLEAVSLLSLRWNLYPRWVDHLEKLSPLSFGWCQANVTVSGMTSSIVGIPSLLVRRLRIAALCHRLMLLFFSILGQGNYLCQSSHIKRRSFQRMSPLSRVTIRRHCADDQRRDDGRFTWFDRSRERWKEKTRRNIFFVRTLTTNSLFKSRLTSRNVERDERLAVCFPADGWQDRRGSMTTSELFYRS